MRAAILILSIFVLGVHRAGAAVYAHLFIVGPATLPEKLHVGLGTNFHHRLRHRVKQLPILVTDHMSLPYQGRINRSWASTLCSRSMEYEVLPLFQNR